MGQINQSGQFLHRRESTSNARVVFDGVETQLKSNCPSPSLFSPNYTYPLQMPPVRQFPDDSPVKKLYTTITGVVTLVENKVEIAARTVDVVD